MDLNIALRTRQLRYVPVELNERDLRSLERICGMKLEPFAWIMALPKVKSEKTDPKPAVQEPRRLAGSASQANKFSAHRVPVAKVS